MKKIMLLPSQIIGTIFLFGMSQITVPFQNAKCD